MFIRTRERFGDYEHCAYELTDLYEINRQAVGGVICRLFVASHLLNVKKVVLLRKISKCDHVEIKNREYSSAGFLTRFKTESGLANFIKRSSIVEWHIYAEYRGESIQISGMTQSIVVHTSYGQQLFGRVNRLIIEVEGSSYYHTRYNNALLDSLSEEYMVPRTEAVAMLRQLEEDREIYKEFVKGSMKRQNRAKYIKISVEGHTALTLYKEYMITMYGAYQILKDMRKYGVDKTIQQLDQKSMRLGR